MMQINPKCKYIHRLSQKLYHHPPNYRRIKKVMALLLRWRQGTYTDKEPWCFDDGYFAKTSEVHKALLEICPNLESIDKNQP